MRKENRASEKKNGKLFNWPNVWASQQKQAELTKD